MSDMRKLLDIVESKEVLSSNEIDSIIEDSLNAACASIQNALGQTDGDVAAMFFANSEAEKRYYEIMRHYIESEMNMK